MGIKQETIIDNRRENTLLETLRRLIPYVRQMDIATGTFELGSLLALDENWQNMDSMRILMGDETTKRTKAELVQSLQVVANASLEDEKEKDDTLAGLPAIRNALATKKIDVRAYTRAKFHAKCYIMDSGDASPVDFGIVGSSNFTRSGLTRNMELNLHTTDQLHIEKLREWYEGVWAQSLDVTEDLLSVITPHLQEYSPFTVYARALYEYFKGREKPQDRWEAEESVIYPLLAQYQRDGYHRALQIADDWNGALICDGVGLGKTFIGLMLLERCIKEGKRVLMIVPKAAQQSVWESNISRYLKPKYKRFFKELFDIRRHTDFGREGTISREDFEYYRDHKQVVIIDEAHHFRNRNANRGQVLWDIAEGKKLYMLTATPINNSLDDLYNLINYFARTPDHFKRIRINNLRKHFIESEKRLEQAHENMETAEAAEADDFLRTDELLQNVLIQRSRKFVKDSESANSEGVIFPERQLPQVVEYSLKAVYSSIYAELKDAFDKENPFLNLPIYNTASYQRNPDDKIVQSQGQVIGLIRTLFLKRLESSFKSFEASVEDLLAKMAYFMMTYSKERYESWTKTNTRWWAIVQRHIEDRLESEADEEDNGLPIYERAGFDPDHHDMERLLNDLQDDMNLLSDFLSKIYRRFYVKGKEGEDEDPTKDEKLQKLLALLNENPLIQDEKVLIFTEFQQTARYLYRSLRAAGFDQVEQVDSGRNVANREDIIRRFSPYYNCFGRDDELERALKSPIRVLISTDVLSEGLNLQDASLLVNYDLHWNPVRLMQRLGRLDRRLNKEIESVLTRTNAIDGKMYFWNFLPPSELDDLLRLKHRLDGKILRINRTLGIEGALLTPDDPEMTIKDFNERFEGSHTTDELMHLEKQRIESDHNDLWISLPDLPRRLFSAKAAGDGFEPFLKKDGEVVESLTAPQTRGIFCCYAIPPALGRAPQDLMELAEAQEQSEAVAQEGSGPADVVKWYFWNAETETVSEDIREAWTAVRCAHGTERAVPQDVKGLATPLKAVEAYIRNTYMRDAQVPAGAKPRLMAWMELT